MAEVYKFTTPDGQEFAWHGPVSELKQAHPGATITARMAPDDIRGATWEPTTHRQASAAERKAAEAEKPADDPGKQAVEPVKDAPAKAAPAERGAVVMVVDENAAKKAEK